MAYNSLSKHTRLIRRNLLIACTSVLAVELFSKKDWSIDVPFLNNVFIGANDSRVMFLILVLYLMISFLVYIYIDYKVGVENSLNDEFKEQNIYINDVKLNKSLTEFELRFMNLGNKYINLVFINESARKNFCEVFLGDLELDDTQVTLIEKFNSAWRNCGFDEAYLNTLNNSNRLPAGNIEKFVLRVHGFWEGSTIVKDVIDPKHFNFITSIVFWLYEGGVVLLIALFGFVSLWYNIDFVKFKNNHIMHLNEAYVIEEETLPPLNPVQLGKGEICEIKAGTHIKDMLFDGAIVTVERFMGEEEYILKYNFNIVGCGAITAITHDNGQIAIVSTSETSIFTQKGAHVGMTVSELERIYPDGKIYHPELPYLMEEFGYYYSVNGLGRFVIHAESVREECGYKYDKCIENISDLKTIKFETY